MTKIIITLLSLTLTMRAPMEKHLIWIRDCVSILIVLINMILPFGSTYGLVLVITLGLFCFTNMFLNIYYDSHTDERIEKLESDLANYKYLVYKLQETNRVLLSQNSELQAVQESVVETAKVISYRVFDECNGSADTEKLYNLVKEFDNKLRQPICTTTNELDLTLGLTDTKQCKRAIYHLKYILKTHNINNEFDKLINDIINEIERN